MSRNRVQEQYERWVYPAPIADLEDYTQAGSIDGSAPKAHHLQYWPDGRYLGERSIDVLVAGCGSNAAARLAYTHPDARVVGIDVSSASLAHERYLKDKHSLENLTLHQLPLESIPSLRREFDFIDCIGVLHHLRDPEVGLRALGRVLRPDGVIAVMLYGRHGRAGVSMLQEVFRLLGTGQGEEDVAMARELASRLMPQHPATHLLEESGDMEFGAGVVDLLLHAQERTYDVGECLDLVERCGLRFQGWLEPFPYHPEGQLPRRLGVSRSICALSLQAQWKAMELIHGLMSAHSFYVCRVDRPEGQLVRWDRPEAMDFVPHPRVHRRESKTMPNGKEGGLIQRLPYGPIPLTSMQYQLFELADGQRTIRQIASLSGEGPRASSVDVARELFERLSRIGLVHCQVRAASTMAGSGG